jgi:hypothetical protein
MPWHIDAEGGRFCVKTGRASGAGDTVKCHPSREEATAHMRALYANATDLSENFPEDTLAIISLDDPTTKVGPRTFRKRILRDGRWAHPNAPNGVLEVDTHYMQRVIANFSAGIWDHVAVTKGHPKDAAEALDLAAGDVVALEEVRTGDPKVDGLYAIFVANADVAPKIGNEIKGASGGIIPNYIDHDLSTNRGAVGPVLGHLALTNEPYIKDLGPFEAAHLANTQRSLLLSERTDLPEDLDMTKEELIAKAKELGIDLATALGLDVAKLEADAADVEKLKGEKTTLEAELEKLKKGEIPPVVEPPKPELSDEAKAAAEAAKAEVVAALGEALVGAGVIELAENEKPTMAGVVGAIAAAVKGGNAAGVALSEQRFAHAFKTAVKEGRATVAQKEGLQKAWIELGEDTFEALTKNVIVELGELGTIDDIDLAEPPGGGIDTTKEVDRYAEMSKTLG